MQMLPSNPLIIISTKLTIRQRQRDLFACQCGVGCDVPLLLLLFPVHHNNKTHEVNAQQSPRRRTGALCVCFVRRRRVCQKWRTGPGLSSANCLDRKMKMNCTKFLACARTAGERPDFASDTRWYSNFPNHITRLGPVLLAKSTKKTA